MPERPLSSLLEQPEATPRYLYRVRVGASPAINSAPSEAAYVQHPHKSMSNRKPRGARLGPLGHAPTVRTPSRSRKAFGRLPSTQGGVRPATLLALAVRPACRAGTGPYGDRVQGQKVPQAQRREQLLGATATVALRDGLEAVTARAGALDAAVTPEIAALATPRAGLRRAVQIELDRHRRAAGAGRAAAVGIVPPRHVDAGAQQHRVER